MDNGDAAADQLLDALLDGLLDPKAGLTDALSTAAKSIDAFAACLPALATAIRDGEGEPLALLQFCEAARESGALEALCELVNHDDASVHQAALVLLAMMSTADVDPLPDLSKQRIKSCGGFAGILNHLFSDGALTVALACGCIQNLVADREHSASLHQTGGVDRLRALVQCDSNAVSAAARACLRNLFL